MDATLPVENIPNYKIFTPNLTTYEQKGVLFYHNTDRTMGAYASTTLALSGFPNHRFETNQALISELETQLNRHTGSELPHAIVVGSPSSKTWKESIILIKDVMDKYGVKIPLAVDTYGSGQIDMEGVLVGSSVDSEFKNDLQALIENNEI